MPEKTECSHEWRGLNADQRYCRLLQVLYGGVEGEDERALCIGSGENDCPLTRKVSVLGDKQKEGG